MSLLIRGGTVVTAEGSARADVYCYEPSWHHGNAVAEWVL